MKPLSFPTRRILSLTLGASFDESVFTGANDFLTYRTSGHHDLWALGARDRISTDEAFAQPGLSRLLPPDRNTPFTAHAKSMPVGPKVSFLYGDTFRFKSGLQIGVSFGLTYDSSYSTEIGTMDEGYIFDFNPDNPNAPAITFPTYTSSITKELKYIPRDGYSYFRSEHNVMLGALASVAVRFNPWHQVSFAAFTSQTATDMAQYDDDIISFNGNPSTPEALDRRGWDDIADRYRYRLNYRERNLSILTLVGEHLFPSARDGRLEWAGAFSTAYQDEPDNRHLMYIRPYGEDHYEVRSGTDVDDGIMRSWRRVEEERDTVRLSWHQPLGHTGAFFEFGGSFSATDRDYNERLANSSVSLADSDTAFRHFDDPDEIWEHIVTRLTPTRGHVSQTMDISGIFLRGSAPLISPRLKLSGGIRFERTAIASNGFGSVPGNTALSSIRHYISGNNYKYFNQFISSANTTVAEKEANVDIDQVDFLPTASLTWNPIDPLTFRLSASKTIARPSLRELGNYYTWDPSRDRYQHGNAFLKISRVRNLDFRAEYFFGGGDLFSLSLFYKEIENPIEVLGVALSSSNGGKVGTWFNNPSTARLRGIEFEFRKNFGFLGDIWQGFSLGGNASWIDAEVRDFTGHPIRGLYTLDETRRLYDQPEWIYNLDLTCEIKRWGSTVTLSWIATSDVLSTIRPNNGADPNQHLDETSRFDLTYTQRLGKRLALKLSVKNLSDPEQRYIRDKDQTGDVTIVDRRWHEGRSFTATLSAEF
jgi:outer membrane receptor protein involved in Fe transport